MKVKNLGHLTDFIFQKYDGKIEDKEDYLVIQTDSNPNYFWGNYVLFPDPPKAGDYKKWVRIFKEEFTNPSIYHMCFSWDSINGEKGHISEFEKAGFKFEISSVLSTNLVSPPPKLNKELKVQPIYEKSQFAQCIDAQTRGSSDKKMDLDWNEFYTKSMAKYSHLVSLGVGKWFAAIFNDKIVGSLGIFVEGEIARYQMVSTDPNFQRRGVCSTLVYESARYAFEHMKVKTLVMVADDNYHAGKIYESVGFKPTAKQAGLCWYDPDRA